LIVATPFVTRLVSNRSRTYVVLGGLFSLGIAAALLGVSRNIPMAAASTFTMGFAIAFVWVPAQTMSQQETPPAMVGRVSSTFMSLISVAQVLGLILSGYLAQKLGIRPLFITCAAALAVISAAGYLMMRGRPAVAATSSAPANANPQSTE